MEVNKILNADILDIIFEGKNKEYGAYELRKTYNKRILYAIVGTAVIILLLFIGYFLSNMQGGTKKQAMVVEDVQLEDVKEEKHNEPPPPPPPKVQPPKVEMAAFTITPFTAKTMPKKATSQSRTLKPVISPFCLRLLSECGCMTSLPQGPKK